MARQACSLLDSMPRTSGKARGGCLLQAMRELWLDEESRFFSPPFGRTVRKGKGHNLQKYFRWVSAEFGNDSFGATTNQFDVMIECPRQNS